MMNKKNEMNEAMMNEVNGGFVGPAAAAVRRNRERFGGASEKFEDFGGTSGKFDECGGASGKF